MLKKRITPRQAAKLQERSARKSIRKLQDENFMFLLPRRERCRNEAQKSLNASK